MEVPAENGGKDDGWSVNGDSSGQATLYQKKDGGQRAGGKVKTVLQELISGIDFKLVIDRDAGNRENYHRNWPAEIKLYEAEDRKSTRLNSSHYCASRIPSPALKKKH